MNRQFPHFHEITIEFKYMTTNLKETYDHVRLVGVSLSEVARNLMLRAVTHDDSKFEPFEAEGFAALKANLRDIEFGSPEYTEALDAAKPVIEHHYALNDHHPQHYESGVNDMSLMAIMEMLADWYASGLRTKNGSMDKSITVNVKRFKIEPQLEAILRNTARYMGWV
jgi:hypothetical protein